MRIEQYVDENWYMSKAHFDQIMNKTLREGLDREVSEWKKQNTMWATALDTFAALETT